MCYKLGSLNTLETDVCRQAFRFAHNMSRSTLSDLCKEIKLKTFSTAVELTDASAITSNSNFKQMQDGIINLCAKFDIILTKEQLAGITIPNTTLELNAYGWMHYYFNTVGDQEPNTDGEIHLGKLNK